MPIDRRRFLDLAASGVVASAFCPTIRASDARRKRFEALAFDAFPVFDPRPIAELAETLFPGKGAELGAAWRTRQFEYQWLRALGGRYEDFWRTTEDALVFAAAQLRLELTAEKRDRLMQAHLELRAWPDAPAALASLKAAGVRLAFLSNMTARMLEDGIRNAKLEGLFEHVLSTDRIRSYKPDPRAYRMAIDAFGLEREQILFVSFAGWDAAGAKWFGYPTFWNNRLGLPAEELGVRPDATGKDLSELAKFVSASV
jgi:2-haloacid dehalogenase